VSLHLHCNIFLAFCNSVLNQFHDIDHGKVIYQTFLRSMFCRFVFPIRGKVIQSGVQDTELYELNRECYRSVVFNVGNIAAHQRLN